MPQSKSQEEVVGVPVGVIVMWSGAVSAIPSGWVICDGNNSTPNLTDRFVIHADADSGGSNNPDDTGGSRTISLANLPAHNHGGVGDHTHTTAIFISGTYFGGGGEEKLRSGTSGGGGGHTHTSVGSGNDYLPKYYALAYIMKT